MKQTLKSFGFLKKKLHVYLPNILRIKWDCVFYLSVLLNASQQIFVILEIVASNRLAVGQFEKNNPGFQKEHAGRL